MQYQWVEDDFKLVSGVRQVGLPEPVNDKKYIMYHGTTRQNAYLIQATGFRQSSGGLLGRGVYLSRDLQKARRFPLNHPEFDKVVIKVVVNVGKVITINYQDHPRQKTWHDSTYGPAYDTAWVPPKCGMVESGLEEDCVWDPHRIKIIRIIGPQLVQASYVYDAWGYAHAIASSMQYHWPQDDFDLPYGVNRLDLPEPVSDKKYIMYHGTTRQNAQAIQATGFKQSANGMLGRGVYLSRDLQKARRYPIGHPEYDKVVIKVVVNVGKVITINYQNHPRQKTWHDSRYGPVFDTAWVPPECGMVNSGLEENCVWDPEQIEIINTIKPRPVRASYGYSAQGYMVFPVTPSSKRQTKVNSQPAVLVGPGKSDTDTNMSRQYRGQKYIMYHGTTREAAKAIKSKGFNRSADGMLGRGVYLSRDQENASRYPIGHPESDRVVIMVEVKVGKVKRIDYEGHPLQYTWRDYGYDTAWVPPGCGMVANGSEEDCVWDPDRIKYIKTLHSSDIGINLNQGYRGQKYIMYHGTTREAAKAIKYEGFRQSAGGMLCRGVYFSRDQEKASRYPHNHPEYDKVVIMVEVNVGRVKKIDYQGHPLQYTWYCNGYDSAWVPPDCGMVKSGLEEDCVWDPSRIKYIKTIQLHKDEYR
ncbi:uncharacterized protein LOC119917978 [Micropterus salmoides]|uniref:uncharacterized protein LOC119917978 n=1 Tax=Micropterus salmoides TaxID=27706 RepID=UPI0018ED02FF|nr:uncharacterized protein LOC119917978 [Micropterus salmoides]